MVVLCSTFIAICKEEYWQIETCSSGNDQKAVRLLGIEGWVYWLSSNVGKAVGRRGLTYSMWFEKVRLRLIDEYWGKADNTSLLGRTFFF